MVRWDSLAVGILVAGNRLADSRRRSRAAGSLACRSQAAVGNHLVVEGTFGLMLSP